MLHQFKKNQMLTRSKKGSYLDRIEMFMASAVRANQQAQQTQLFIEDCIRHLKDNGNIDTFKKSIVSVCNNQLSFLNRLIIVGSGLAAIDKGFENPFSFIAVIDKIKDTAKVMEKIITDTQLDTGAELVDAIQMSLGEHMAKRFKSL